MKRIDNIKLAGRAYTNSPARANGPNQIEFHDYKEHEFLISGSNFKAIDTNQLYDTLKYDGIVFSILTDENGYKTFYKINNDRRIEVYDIIIGNTSFIKLEKINNAELNKRYFHLILLFATYISCLIYYFWSKGRE